MNLNFDAWKNAAAPILRTVCVAGYETREQAKAIIRKEMDAAALDGTKRRFIADYCMSQLGLGGGF